MEASIAYAFGIPLPEPTQGSRVQMIDRIKFAKVDPDVYTKYLHIKKRYRIKGLQTPALIGSAILQLMALRITLTETPAIARIKASGKAPDKSVSQQRQTEKDSKIFALYDSEFK